MNAVYQAHPTCPVVHRHVAVAVAVAVHAHDNVNDDDHVNRLTERIAARGDVAPSSIAAPLAGMHSSTRSGDSGTSRSEAAHVVIRALCRRELPSLCEEGAERAGVLVPRQLVPERVGARPRAARSTSTLSTHQLNWADLPRVRRDRAAVSVVQTGQQCRYPLRPGVSFRSGTSILNSFRKFRNELTRCPRAAGTTSAL